RVRQRAGANARRSLCRWDDLSPLLLYTARAAYTTMSCAQREDVNQRIWWLADPLYLEPGNERRSEQYAREMVAALHAGNDVDERFDMRDDYEGPAVRELVLRYGWPASFPVPFRTTPPGWSRFDTHDVHLGLGGIQIRYWGPQYHTFADWSAVLDPVHSKPGDWDLGPEREDSVVWDFSWWAPEFYDRVEGPLVDLSTQIAFLRRDATAVVAAAMEWGIDPAILAPPRVAAVGVITAGNAREQPHIVGATMDGAHPRAILTPIESRPLLLGVEMVPKNDSGAAGRTRFGVAPPPPLRALARNTIALSDVILVRGGPTDPPPTTVQETLTRMYGSTRLENPTRLALFWEVYGQRDGDTVDVTIRFIRRSTAGLLTRAASAVGIGHVADDTILIRWHEPRPGDPLATVEGGVSIRPRSVAVDVAAMAAGDYTVDVHVDRRGVSAASDPRVFSIVR
ncbi:MAG TPA: hypothetical protein VMH39_16505, partial [Gemmatimonadaceae bacterium]|nr:hypothetical protein [Gemmatimonadaceae bacterium]